MNLGVIMIPACPFSWILPDRWRQTCCCTFGSNKFSSLELRAIISLPSGRSCKSEPCSACLVNSCKHNSKRLRQGGGSVGKKPVVGIRDENGNVKAKAVKGANNR